MIPALNFYGQMLEVDFILLNLFNFEGQSNKIIIPDPINYALAKP